MRLRIRLMRHPSIGFMLFAFSILAVPASATPPDYTTFGRTQQESHTPNPDDLMRIWLVYVEQGDGLLIQLPPRCNYDSDPQDGDNTSSERVDILIDGGANPQSQAWRMAEFVETLYGADGGSLEYAVITHHDQDHVLGLGYLLDENSFSVDTIFHNGLASYVGGASIDGAPDFPTSTQPQDAVYKWSSDHITRGMAFLEPGTSNLRPEYIIDSLTELRTAFNDNKLQGVYLNLADAIIGKSSPAPVRRFNRASTGSDFIAEGKWSYHVVSI